MIRLPIAAMFFILGSTPILMTADTKPTLNKTPLSDDQLEVYRTFLRTYSIDSKQQHLNLANRTRPLDLRKEKLDEKCLKGIELDNEAEAETTFHILDPKFAPHGNITLVDPGKQRASIANHDSAVEFGLLTLSEVAFNKNHKYAAMSYSFFCGGLCGDGSILVFANISGKWVRTDRSCWGWIS